MAEKSNGFSKAQLSAAMRIIRKSMQTGAPDWVADNAHLIDRQYRLLRRTRLRTAQKELLSLALAYLTEVGWKPDEDSLCAFLRVKAEVRPFSYDELCAVLPMLGANALLRIAAICAGSKSASLLPEVIGVLRILPEIDTEALFAQAWAPEKLLAEAERDYPLYSPETKRTYRQALHDAAKRHHRSEEDEVKHLSRVACDKQLPLGTLLLSTEKTHWRALLWWVLFFLLWGSAAVGTLFAFGWAGLLVLLPEAQGIAPLCDRVTAAFGKEHAPLRLSLQQIPEDATTVVAITTLLQEGAFDPERLERFYYLNPDDNLYFCLLADFPEADAAVCPGDTEAITALCAAIDRLNRAHGERFFLLYRDREPNGQGAFGGKERKRGAVGALIRSLSGEEAGHVYGACPQNARFLLTLDADTELSIGSVRALLGVALHPVNQAYGVFQPGMQTELSSSYRTHFTRLFSGSAGSSDYERACFDRNQSLYGEGIFCGKGLLDIARFRKHAMSLPEGCILSHDLPEGGLLHTLPVPDLTFSDSVPCNPAAWEKRAHRWIRGDVQNLRFLLPGAPALSGVSKRQIIWNILRHLTPVSALAALLCMAFRSVGEGSALLYALCACTHVWLPFLLGMLSRLRHCHPFLLRHARTAGLSAQAEQTLKTGYELCHLCRNALLSLDGIVRALYRMTVSHRKLLEWTTATAGETGSGRIGVYLKNGLPGACIGVLLFLFGHASVFRLLGVLFFVDPMLSYLLSLPLSDGSAEVYPVVTEKDRALLLQHASDQWRFFADTVNRKTHFLPPDNLQLAPDRSLAMPTSPTNIGLFLLSVLAALDLGFADEKEAADRLERALATVEALPKYHGNLYNWYDLETLHVIGEDFVSFVDSGNLLVCLRTLQHGLEERRDAEERFPALALLAKRLADETDLSVFYHPRKKLFSLGLNGKTGQLEHGCYDLLMSEARTASYYAVAAGIAPKKHWDALGRTVSSARGYIGMVSWSGTMFEYFMPQLFLPIYRDSFLQETLLFAARAQRAAAKGGLWGVSESGYYAFDGQLHYRYRAHGIRALALRRDVCGETVIAPYATYLTLCVCPSSAVKNLRALESTGMYGTYGLYEAFDRTPSRSESGVAVRSYMAHHVGMSLLAIDNALQGRPMVKRFLSDPRMRAAVGLLQEKLPQEPVRTREDLRPEERRKHRKQTVRKAESDTTDLASPRACLLQKDGFSACITSLGHVRLQKGERQLNVCETERFSVAHSLTVAFPDGDTVYGCTPFFGSGAYAFSTDATGATLLSESKRFSARVRFSFCRRADCFRIEAEAEKASKCEVLFAFEPMLSDRASFAAHPSFSKLFTESTYDPDTRILYFTRRDRETGRDAYCLGVALQDEQADFRFCTSKDGFPPERMLTPADLTDEPDGKTGICIDPFCVIRTERLPGSRATLLLAAGESVSEVRSALLIARREKESFRACSLPETDRILGELLFPHAPEPNLWLPYRKELLWKYGISGDFPLLYAAVGESETQTAKNLLHAFAELLHAGIRTELLLLPLGDGQYFRPTEKKLLTLCEELELQGFLGVRGGIFLLRKEQTENGLSDLLPHICAYTAIPSKVQAARPILPITSFRAPVTQVFPIPCEPEEAAVSFAGGWASEKGITLNKAHPFPSVRSYVLTGKSVGSIVTASSLGYTFCGNAHEHRLTPFPGDPGCLSDGERLYLKRGGTLYDLLACSCRVFFGKGCAMWEGQIDRIAYSVICFCCTEKPIKVVRVLFSAPAGELLFCLRPVMGSGISPTNVLWKKEQSGALVFRSGEDMAFADGVGVLYAKGATPLYGQSELFCDRKDGFSDLIGLRAGYNYVNFFLGGCTQEELQDLLKAMKDLSAESEQSGAEAFAEAMCPPITVRTKCRSQDLFFNRLLPYQIAACRFRARASYKQSGGAFGFRDQLQDCLALLYSDPHAVRAHLLRCCAHQYEEGDVQHWWHEGGMGLRTTCSDDLLWLPIAVANYVNKTGDTFLLEEQVSYLSSPPLHGENERYELAAKSFLSESVRLHCLRVFSQADKRGRHGLIRMGCCDWNDAFSAVGAKGRGESVFSTLLYIVAVRAFLPLLSAQEVQFADRLRQSANELLQNVETHAFDGDRYVRAFCDGGEVLGKRGAEECEIDILTQAFALFAGADAERCKNALAVAEKQLYDPKHKTLALLTPPFSAGSTPVGYIRGYPSGIRENGGQYTHAAIWGALAFLRIGKTDTALELLSHMNPLLRTKTDADAETYRNEPYALCADLYTGKYAGRGGWSWYTGSAAWYYKVFLEEVLGIRLSYGGRLLDVRPRVAYEAALRYRGTLHIRVSRTENTTLDGVPIRFPVTVPDGDHTVCVRLE